MKALLIGRPAAVRQAIRGFKVRVLPDTHRSTLYSSRPGIRLLDLTDVPLVRQASIPDAAKRGDWILHSDDLEKVHPRIRETFLVQVLKEPTASASSPLALLRASDQIALGRAVDEVATETSEEAAHTLLLWANKRDLETGYNVSSRFTPASVSALRDKLALQGRASLAYEPVSPRSVALHTLWQVAKG